MFLFADKSSNVYQVSPEFYRKLLLENVTKDYTIVEPETAKDIDEEAQCIASELKLADRIECHSDAPAFITVKDHKENFHNNTKCRLINPAKSQIGIISKQILQTNNKKLREITGLNQWQSTKEVISWFNNIRDKPSRSLLQLDIVEYYPSISEDLLNKAFKFAENSGAPFTEQQKEIIRHSRRSILFTNSTPDGDDKPWQKTKNPDFDVTMGAPDGAEVCELVGLYILDELRRAIPNMNFGLYRDDGLAEHKKMRGQVLEKISQKITKLFETFGLKITIQTNMQQVDFLDVTFRLSTEDFKPYKKPNNRLLYVNTSSNHPPTVIKQIPIGINTRLSNISSTEQHFDDAKTDYQTALETSGHNYKLTYQPPRNKTSKKIHRRNIIWYNPPFSLGVKTNVGKKFLELVSTHFPKNHPLHPIFNRNTLKISYSCTKNFKQIIQSHNKKVLSKKKAPNNQKNMQLPKKQERCMSTGRSLHPI